jgi:elongation factor 1-gamma
MPFGKIYSFPENVRTIPVRAVAKAYNIDLELVHTHPSEGIHSDYIKKINPLGKIPSFEGVDGFILTESIAIAIYITSQNEKTTLLGKTKQDYASILRWMCFANEEMVPTVRSWILPLAGREPYNKKNVDEAIKKSAKVMDALEQHLSTHTFLVGERITLADIFAASLATRGFQTVFDKKWREEHPNVTRWFDTVHHQPIFSAVAGEPKYIDEAIKYQPPKKEPGPKKEQAPKKEEASKPKAKETENEAEEDEEKPAPKPKHPLEALGKPEMVLDDWKRKYSNEDTRSAALPWFWENYKPEEYSLWRVDYKYNDELTQTFMSSNLIGGFFNRLEASRKYLFGTMSVFGKANESVMVGAFLVRGQEALPAFDVAPDYESFDFTKLDPTKEEDKAFLEDQWDMEKGITVDGKDYPFADGKVFK